MVKKIRLYILILLALSLVISLINITSAQLPTDDLQNQVSNVQNKLENIPKTPEEIRDQYLRLEWGKLFSENKYIGPVHNFFVANPLIFKIIFNEPYSFSLTFFAIVFFWLFIFILSFTGLNAYFKSALSLPISIGIAIIFAQATIIKLVVLNMFNLIFARETWWLRVILWLIAFAIIIVLYYVDNTISQNIKKAKAAKEKAEIKQKLAESQAFIKGAKEGKKIADDYQI